jgi:anti-anti-sigma factor
MGSAVRRRTQGALAPSPHTPVIVCLAGITMTDALVLPAKLLTLTTRHTARFDARWTMSSVAIVSAYGDIDASNASTLTDYAVVNAVRCHGLILDLSGLEFFGTDGFSALHRVSVRCARANIGWIAVPGAAVSRLLRVCDPHGSLPGVDTVRAALANLQDQHAGRVTCDVSASRRDLSTPCPCRQHRAVRRPP